MMQFPHAQCNNCGKMIRGPHENEVYDQRRDAAGGIEPVYAADAEAVYYQDEAEAKGLAYNVGSSMCTDCYQSTYRKYQQSKRAIEAAGPHRAEVRESRRLHQEKVNAAIEARKAEKEAARQAREAYAAQGKPPEYKGPIPGNRARVRQTRRNAQETARKDEQARRDREAAERARNAYRARGDVSG